MASHLPDVFVYAMENFPLLDWNLQRRACQSRGIGVQGNCSSKSCGGEDDSTGLRTQTADITPRTRCVPPEALNSAATAKTKSAETGSRQVPRFGFCTPPERQSYDRRGDFQNDNQGIGAPGKEMNPRPVSGCVCCGDPSKFSVFCFCACSSFSFWPVAQMWDVRRGSAGNEARCGLDGEQGDGGQKRDAAKFSHQNSSVTNRDLFEIYTRVSATARRPENSRKSRRHKKWAALLLPRRPCSFPPVGKALKNRSDCPADSAWPKLAGVHVAAKQILDVLNDKEAMARRGPRGGGPTEIHKSHSDVRISSRSPRIFERATYRRQRKRVCELPL